ncbi:lysine biosynthesis protein LysW [Actinosynnema sp. NPDC023658]|uniref:lysine biosynthesis protein LysW n=1 Tax=Actinosynnema sp. NPDC023658 TaxID=3155465 RepID=UPI00340C2BDC
MNAQCVSCDSEFEVRTDSYPGEIVGCPGCNAELEILSMTPVELAIAPEPEEDWGE